MLGIFVLVYGFGVGHSKGLLLLLYTTCYLAYIALGGLVFLAIEGPRENAEINKLETAKANFLKKYPCLTEEAVDDFLHEVTSFKIRGLQAPNSTAGPKWTYTQSVFFSVTLLTTIGYGHVAPVSQLGKAACMIYTGLGIPFTLLLLAAYVQRLMSVAQSLQKALSSCFGKMFQPVIIRLLHFSIITVTIGLTFFILPALFFSNYEDDWTYLDAIYFCFISLTTVGLGDFVPAENPDKSYPAIYRVGVTFFVMAGLTAMMFLMALTGEFQDFVTHKQDPEKIQITSTMESYGAIVIEKGNVINETERTKLLSPNAMWQP